MHPIAYLAFDGTCAEAMRFYEKTLNGKIEMMMTGSDSPMADQIPKEHAHRIIHARLALPGGGVVYAGDAPTNMPYQGIHGVALVLNFETEEEGRRVFDALAAGGRVTMPQEETFWAKAWGMLTDRFGMSWHVNGGLKPM